VEAKLVSLAFEERPEFNNAACNRAWRFGDTPIASIISKKLAALITAKPATGRLDNMKGLASPYGGAPLDVFEN
jgi:hypothetical protein